VVVFRHLSGSDGTETEQNEQVRWADGETNADLWAIKCKGWRRDYEDTECDDSGSEWQTSDYQHSSYRLVLPALISTLLTVW
jgi:hypothetical protein